MKNILVVGGGGYIGTSLSIKLLKSNNVKIYDEFKRHLQPPYHELIEGIEIDYDMYLAGLTDALETGIVKLDQQQRRQVMSSLQKSIRNRGKVDGEKNLKVAEDFLKNNKLNNPNIKETPSGLQYSVITAGSGDSPNKTDRVKVHYVGTLIDGSEFDSSIKRGEPAVFGLDQVIRGWTEGLQLMKVGAKYKFYIHPKIAYGSRDKPGIPANSALVFEVELLDIVKDSSPNKK